MNRLKRAIATLVAVTGISLAIGSTPAVAVTSVEHGGSTSEFHCC
jgi:hypothetical protein